MSQLEELLAYQIRLAKLPEPVRELRFAKPRRWRADFAWPSAMVACEVDGGTWINGRHSRGSGVEADCEKASAAAILGWRVLRVTGAHVKDGRALQWIEQALGYQGPQEHIENQRRDGRDPQATNNEISHDEPQS